jgi:ParB family transcriptional regulator, chromosome partitioning protein
MSALPTTRDFFGAVPIEPEKPKAFAGLTLGQDDNEWYTPRHVVELARKALGGIDLDPASCALAQQTVQADAFYDKHINGLEQPWFGRTWLNPPYSRDLMAKFAGRLLHQYEKGNVESGILLTHNCIETSWFQICAAGAASVCFPRGRLRFHNPSRTTKSTPGVGQALLYFGPDPNRFDDVFGAIGLVMGRATP